jgi:hypothetical protein
MVSGVLLIIAAFALPYITHRITSSSEVGSERHRLFGVVMLAERTSFSFYGQRCVGVGVYADLRAGTAVVVSDATRNQLASGELEPGAVTSEGTCQFRFNAALPEVGSYRFTVGNQSPSDPVTIWAIDQGAPESVDQAASSHSPGDWWHTLVLD